MKLPENLWRGALVAVTLLLAHPIAFAQVEASPGGQSHSHSNSQQDSSTIGVIGVSDTAEPVFALSLKTDPQTLQKLSPTRYSYNYGEIDPLKTPKLELPLVVRNISKAPVFISRVTTTCGCTSAIPNPEKKGSREKPLQPGEETTLGVVVDFTRVYPGVSTKVAYFCIGEERKIVAALEMSGTTHEVVSFSPRMIDFGRLPAGTGQSLSMTLTMDERLTPVANRLALFCSSPDVTVERQGEDLQVTQGTRKFTVRRYQVSVSPRASLGKMAVGVTFIRPGQVPGMPIAEEVPAAERLLMESRVSFTGEIMGTVAAEPQALVFAGGLPVTPATSEGGAIGSSARTQRITLTGLSPEALNDLKLSTRANWFTARVVPGKAGGTSDTPGTPTATIEVTLSPGILLPDPEAAGEALIPLQEDLEVQTRAGERMRIQVLAVVGASTAAAAGVTAAPLLPARQ